MMYISTYMATITKSVGDLQFQCHIAMLLSLQALSLSCLYTHI